MLTTKDGFCDTLRSLHLPLAELWPFTFPCWILPRDLSPLAQRLQEAAEAPEAAPPSEPEASPETLAAELSLLRRAHGYSRAGDHEAALRVLAEHRQTFPAGALGAEREAAVAIALCGAGRREEGRAAAERFSVAHPASPLRARVRSACQPR